MQVAASVNKRTDTKIKHTYIKHEKGNLGLEVLLY